MARRTTASARDRIEAEVPRRYLTAEQAASYLGWSRKAVYRLVAVGQIPFRRVARRRLVFDREAIDRWVEALPGTSDVGAPTGSSY